MCRPTTLLFLMMAALVLDVTSCHGFLLMLDSGSPGIYYTNETTFSTITTSGLTYPVALSYDHKRNVVYWSDITNRTISRIDLDGTNQQVIWNLNEDSVAEGLAVDPISRLIFYTDTGEDIIAAITYDGAHIKYLITSGLEEPRAIALDVQGGEMFWTDWGTNAKIEVASMDGSNRRTIVSNDLMWPNGIFLDTQEKKIYWCDAGTDKIEVASMKTGFNRKTIRSITGFHPFGIVVTEKWIYFSEWTTYYGYHWLWFFNKNGTGTYRIKGPFGKLNGIVSHNDTYTETKNFCSKNNGNCSYLCLPTPTYRTCACPDTAGLTQFGNTCSDIDECAINNGNCTNLCMNNVGSYICTECPSGQLKSSVNNICEDADVCQPDNHIVIKDEIKRSATYTFNSSVDIAICDRRLTMGWYRVESEAGSDMPTSFPGANKCGTNYPIWLNGTLPTDGNTVNRKACIPFIAGLFVIDTCISTIDIQIKNCEGFNVYYIVPPGLCPASYCFGNRSKCPEGESSDTGYTPCSANFPNIIVNPTVDYTVETAILHKVVFKCGITHPNTTNLQFDVIWYKEDEGVTEIHSENGIEQANMPASLKEAQYTKFGIYISCKLRGRIGSTGTPGFWKTSESFYAGIKILTTDLTVVEGDTNPVELKFKLTVPISCIANFPCKLEVNINVPEYQNELATCANKDTLPQIVFQEKTHCGVELDPSNWNQEHTLKVYATRDAVYDGDSITLVRLGTQPLFFHMPAWQSVPAHDVRIKVIDKDQEDIIANKYCFSYNDPHMRTTDGRTYEFQSFEGEFVMFRHKTLPIEVQARFQRCNGVATCNSGVAIKSGGDVFIIDGSRSYHEGVHSRLKMGVIGCDQNAMRITQTNNGKDYEVYLPSGGKVKISAGWGNWMNIEIYPSLLDINNSEGLCGDFNGDGNDDEINREILYNNWAVDKKPQESLFQGGIRQTNYAKHLYCTCKTETATLTDELQCSLNEITQNCINKINEITAEQFQNCRTRRDTESHDEVGLDFDDFATTFAPKPNLTIEVTWKNGWTEEKARSLCEQKIVYSSSGIACSDVQGVDFNATVENCITDIKLTGNTTFLVDSVTAMTGQCYNNLVKNVSAWISDNSTGNSTTFSPPGIFGELCPNECNFQGVCVNGSCICNGTWIGSDCSINPNKAPDLIGLPQSGHCDSNKRLCQKTPVYGNIFFKSELLTCQVSKCQINSDGIRSSCEITYHPAKFVTFSEAICYLSSDSSRKRRSTDISPITAYIIKVSNDNVTYNENGLELLKYNSKCWNCSDTGNCTRQLDICFINNECYSKGENNSFCQTCNTEVSNMTWTQLENTCLIGGTCYASGQNKSDSNCETCNPEVSNATWTQSENTCLIGGTCYTQGQNKSDSTCERCDTSISKTKWTIYTCKINGQCYTAGEIEPNETCSVCNPGLNNTGWSYDEACSSQSTTDNPTTSSVGTTTETSISTATTETTQQSTSLLTTAATSQVPVSSTPTIGTSIHTSSASTGTTQQTTGTTAATSQVTASSTQTTSTSIQSTISPTTTQESSTTSTTASTIQQKTGTTALTSQVTTSSTQTTATSIQSTISPTTTQESSTTSTASSTIQQATGTTAATSQGTTSSTPTTGTSIQSTISPKTTQESSTTSTASNTIQQATGTTASQVTTFSTPTTGTSIQSTISPSTRQEASTTSTTSSTTQQATSSPIMAIVTDSSTATIPTTAISTTTSPTNTPSDPCLTHMVLCDEINRSPGNLYDAQVDTAICDRRIKEGWYRVATSNGENGDMIEYPPPNKGCGTTYGIWLNDTIPSVADGEVNRLACVPFSIGSYSINNCSASVDVKVKNCSSFNVYYLVQTGGCDIAYCFEYRNKGISNSCDITTRNPEVSSATGITSNIASSSTVGSTINTRATEILPTPRGVVSSQVITSTTSHLMIKTISTFDITSISGISTVTSNNLPTSNSNMVSSTRDTTINGDGLTKNTELSSTTKGNSNHSYLGQETTNLPLEHDQTWIGGLVAGIVIIIIGVIAASCYMYSKKTKNKRLVEIIGKQGISPSTKQTHYVHDGTYEKPPTPIYDDRPMTARSVNSWTFEFEVETMNEERGTIIDIFQTDKTSTKQT